MAVAHLKKPFDYFSEEMRQGCSICYGGVGSNRRAIAVALLAVCGDEGIEQERQPVLSKVFQHLSVSARSQNKSL